MIHFIKSSSLNQRLSRLLLVCFIPLTIMMIYSQILVYQISQRYESIVDNITIGNEYNLTFKEDLDYTMYIITANSDRASELVDMEKPHRMIASAIESFGILRDRAESVMQRSRCRGIIKVLETLDTHVSEIIESANVVGMYDTNMQRLEMDIRIITELIQDNIQEYISAEVNDLADLKIELRKEVVRTIVFSFLFLILILFLASYLSHRILKSITKGIGKIQSVTRKAGKGDFSSRIDVGQMDEELAELGEGYNQMVQRLDALVQDIKNEQLNLRLTEQKLLQAQINPHFLYNTLDNIIWLAESGEKEQVIMMVTALSDFFRTTLSKGRDYITVQEEESHIRSYLQIQQFRYQDILEYEINMSKEIYRYQILKLTLQPLVENALYHGIKNKRGMGRILVEGWKEDEDLILTVTDNGIGMTQERLAEVLKEMESEDTGNKHSFGLYNVLQRIRLNYGKQYGMMIESAYGEGTKIIVRIPALEDCPIG